MGLGSLACQHLLFDCDIRLGTDRVSNEMAGYPTDQQGKGGGEKGLEPGKNQCDGWRVNEAEEAEIEDENEVNAVPV